MKNFIIVLSMLFILYSCNTTDSVSQTKVINTEENVSGENTLLVAYTGGFHLTQKSDIITLKFDDIDLKEWGLQVPQELPFVYDEGCDLLTKKLDEVNIQTSGSIQTENWKQLVWEKLSIDEKKSCIKENIMRTVFVDNIESGYYYFGKRGYEGKEGQIFNASTSKKYEKLYNAGEFQKVDVVSNSMYVYFVGGMGNIQYLDKLNSDGTIENIAQADEESISFKKNNTMFQGNEPKIKDFNIDGDKINIEYNLSSEGKSQYILF